MHSDNRDVHVEATNNNVPADVAPAAAPVADKHVADSTDNVAPVATDSLSTPTVTKPDYSYAFRDSTIYEVIPYSDNIPVGTPTAGYVDERGGIRNTGLGEHQISLSTDFFFKVCKGKVVAYDELVSVINERTDWTAKGGIFEGLVGEEAVFALEAWGIYYPEDSDLKKFFEYALGDKAGQEIPAETAENIKAKIDLVRMNNTLEGLPYDKSRTVTASYYNECEDKLTYAGHKTSGGKKRTGGGEGLSRWFRRSGVVPVQKAFIETPSTIEIKKEYVVDTTYIQSPVVYVKSNELGDERIEKSKVIRTATVGEVQNLEPEDRNVSVETSGQATSGKKKKACNARKKEKQRAARELAAAQNRTFMVQQRYARNS